MISEQRMFKKIENSYNDNNYKKALYYIDKYFSYENVGVFEELLDIYIDCQIKLGMFEEARKSSDLTIKLFPNYYSSIEKAILYVSCRNSAKLDKMLEEVQFSNKEYYWIAKKCFYNGQQQKAEELFKRFLEKEENPVFIERAKKFLGKIELYKTNHNIFIETSYANFKAEGRTLEPGNIIMAKQIRPEYRINYTNKDPKRSKRPYMIWKIEEDRIYAFGLSTELREFDSYILSRENYCKDYDRRVIDTLTCIKECDVQKVIGNINQKDYIGLIADVYHKLSHYLGTSIKGNDFFIESIVMDLGITEGDLITFADVSSSVLKLKSYFVLEIDDQNKKFKSIEVVKGDNNILKLTNSEFESVPFNTPIIKVEKLDSQQREKLKAKSVKK